MPMVWGAQQFYFIFNNGTLLTKLPRYPPLSLPSLQIKDQIICV